MKARSRWCLHPSSSRFSAFILACGIIVYFSGCGGGSSSGGSSGGSTTTTSTPTPAISSISPAKVPAGSSDLTLTVNGSGFLSTSVVEVNGTAETTSYVSSAQSTAMVPASQLVSAAELAVVVSNGPANSGYGTPTNLEVDNPTPQFTAISPSGATTGDPATTITVTGSSFVKGAQVVWNGTPLSTTVVSSVGVTAQIPASDLTTASTVSIQVQNPSPGGGTSGSQPFTIYSGATRVVGVPLGANDIAWDPAHGLIYASVPAASGSVGSLVAFNPITAATSSPVAAGSNPNQLTVTSDGSELWVGEDGTGSVQRFALPALTPNLQFTLPTSGAQIRTALSLRAAPGSADTVAVLLTEPDFGGFDSNGVAIYDDATQRPTGIGSSTSGLTALEWGANDTTLYGNQGEYGTWGLEVLGVDRSGVSVATVYPYEFSEVLANEQRVHFDVATGHLYGDDGRVVDPATGNLVGTYNLQGIITQSNFSTLCVVDSAQGLVFILGQTENQWQSNTGYTIRVFNRSTFQLLNSLTIPQFNGTPQQFIRWGNAGLAFNTVAQQNTNQISTLYLVDGNFVDGAATPDFSNGAGTEVIPAPTTITPQSVTAGSTSVTMTMSGANFTPGAVVYWNGQALETDYERPVQLQATVPASDLTSPGVATVTVSNGGGAAPSEAQLAFTIVPAGMGLTALNLAAYDVAWDPKSGLLYAAVASGDPTYPNSIVAVDPTTGAVVKSGRVGADPRLVRTTADGAYLYVGYMASSFITRLQLPGLNSPLTWPLGTLPANGPLMAVDLQPSPVASQTVAVAGGTAVVLNNLREYLQTMSNGTLTIFDNNVPRPATLPGTNAALDQNHYDSIQWAADGATIYAADTSVSDLDLYKLSVNQQGVTYEAYVPGAVDSPVLDADPDWYIWNFFSDIHYDFGTGLIYDDNGLIINPVTGAQSGEFGTSFGWAAPDSSTNAVFILQLTNQMSVVSGGGYTIASYNQKTFAPVGSLALNGIVGQPMKLIRWGGSGLAFATDTNQGQTISGPPGMLYILNDPALIPAGPAVAARTARDAGGEMRSKK